MSSLLTIVLIGISLSMDAFSLALAYGMIGLTKKQKISLSLIVGTYHFIMPLIGLLLGTFIETHLSKRLNIITTIILLYLGITLIISNSKEDSDYAYNKGNFLIFGLSVSIDSLIVGVGLKSITNSYISSSVIFSIISSLCTYLGLVLGNVIGSKVGAYSKILGGITLIILAIALFIT